MSRILTLCLVCFFTWTSFVFATPELKEITVSPDLKRVALQLSAPVKRYNQSLISGPTRLVLDLDGVTVHKPRLFGFPESGLAVRTAKTSHGSRVVLDFGGASKPAYQIHKMGNYLLIFLGEAAAESGSTEQVNWKEAACSTRAIPVKAPTVTTSSGALTIRSATSHDDAITLQVSDKNRPDAVYTIDLRVDLDRPGFNAANIKPMTVASSAATSAPPPRKGGPVKGKE